MDTRTPNKKARTEEDDNEALRAKIAQLVKERAQLVKERDQEGETFAKLEQERTMNSLLSVLPGEAKELIPPLHNRGTNTSHIAPKNEKANETKRKFIVPNVIPVCRELGVDLTKGSCLRAIINSDIEKRLVYENEYDVQTFVDCSLRDATRICNEIIKKISAGKKIPARTVLSVRRESSIFNNILDHAVVFDTVSGAPVFSVETKTPWGSLTPKVYKQLDDQLREMQGKGHPNPFGALTCIDETYIFWLDNSYSKAVLNKLENDSNDSNGGYSKDRLDSIVGGLPIKDATEQYCTQSPAKEKTPDHRYVGETTGFIPLPSREVSQSELIKAEGMVAAFVSAIICSLDGFQNPREIKSFEKDQKVKVEALCLSPKSHKWGTLQTVHKGPMINRTWNKMARKKLYLVDHLGTGSTSKVYRALTEDGYDCVVKMYVQRRDANKTVLTKKEFTSIANAAVTKEVKMLKQIYKELKEYVWQQTFEGMPCVIHPYFKHPDNTEREDLLPKIKERLLKCFSIRNDFYAFAPSDQAWRHVGFFNEKLYMFDLADLESRDIAESEELVNRHIAELRRRVNFAR